MIKKIFSYVSIFMMMVLFLTACGQANTENQTNQNSPDQTVTENQLEIQEESSQRETEAEESQAAETEVESHQHTQKDISEIKVIEGKPVVTATTTFVSDMVKVLAGDFVETQLIIPAGEDPHLYETKPQDLEKLSQADLVIYHGLHFEGKMVDVLESLGYDLTRDFPASKIGNMDQDGDLVVDPHFWFDIDLYKLAVDNAQNYLQALLPDNADTIAENAENYKAELDAMNKECTEKMDTIPQESRFLITPHDAFNYFSREFNIPVMAPQGISTDSEVANKDIQNTVDFIVENKVKAIFAESTTDPARMEKLKEACTAQGFDVEVVSGEGRELFSDSLAPEGSDGDTFLTMFKHNVDLIVENLK